MSLVTLVTAYPRRVSDGQAVEMHMAGGGSRPFFQLGITDWRSGITTTPRFASEFGFSQDGWTGSAVPSTGALAFYPSRPEAMAEIAGLYWIDAPITVRSGDDEATGTAYPVTMTGTVASVQVQGGAIVLTLTDLAAGLNVPVLTARFSGEGGIDGDADVAGRIKRRSLGRCWNVEGRVVSAAHNIHEFGDPSRPMQAFDRVRDIGRPGTLTVLGWQGSAIATFEALKAAVVAKGGGVVAPSIACVKWWTQPSVLTADLRGETGGGYVETAPEIAARIAGIAAVPIANVAALVTLRGAAAGLHLGNEAETIAQALDRLLLPTSTLWTLEPAGAIRLGEIGFDIASVETLRSHSVTRKQVYKPVSTVRLGFQRNERQQGKGEIAGADVQVGWPDVLDPDGTRPADGATRNVFRGIHDPALAYAAGDEVTDAANARSYVAKSAIPAGISLTNTAFWDLRLVSSGGAAGDAAVDVRLTNSVVAVPTDADGSGGNYAGLSCQVEVYDGTVRKDQTGTVAFALVGAPAFASVSGTGLVTIGDWGATAVDLKVDTTYRGVTYRTTIRLIRTLAGAAGPAVTLVGGGAFSFTDGIATPAEQTLTFRLGRQNATGDAVWTTDPAGIALAGDGDIRTLSVVALGGLQQVTLRASVGGVYDEDIAIRVDRSTAAAGADVTKDHTSKDTYAVGGRGVEQLLYSIDINTTSLLGEALRQDDLVQIFDARTLLEGQPVGTTLLEFRNEQKTVNSALIADVKLMGARNADGTAWNMALNSVYVGPGKTFSRHLQEVGAVIDGATVSVKFLQDVFVGDGQSYAKSILRSEADGVFGAFSVTADSIARRSTIALVANELIFVDNSRGNATSPFRVAGGTTIATNFQADTITYGSLVQRFTEVGRQRLDLNGWYQEIPGGMTMMGGRVRRQINSETTFSITFPKPFQIQILSVGAMPFLNSFSNLRDLYMQNIGEPTLTGTVFGTQASTKNSQRLDGFDWWAWGN